MQYPSIACPNPNNRLRLPRGLPLSPFPSHSNGDVTAIEGANATPPFFFFPRGCRFCAFAALYMLSLHKTVQRWWIHVYRFDVEQTEVGGNIRANKSFLLASEAAGLYTLAGTNIAVICGPTRSMFAAIEGKYSTECLRQILHDVLTLRFTALCNT